MRTISSFIEIRIQSTLAAALFQFAASISALTAVDLEPQSKVAATCQNPLSRFRIEEVPIRFAPNSYYNIVGQFFIEGVTTSGDPFGQIQLKHDMGSGAYQWITVPFIQPSNQEIITPGISLDRLNSSYYGSIVGGDQYDNLLMQARVGIDRSTSIFSLQSMAVIETLIGPAWQPTNTLEIRSISKNGQFVNLKSMTHQKGIVVDRSNSNWLLSPPTEAIGYDRSYSSDLVAVNNSGASVGEIWGYNGQDFVRHAVLYRPLDNFSTDLHAAYLSEYHRSIGVAINNSNEILLMAQKPGDAWNSRVLFKLANGDLRNLGSINAGPTPRLNDSGHAVFNRIVDSSSLRPFFFDGEGSFDLNQISELPNGMILTSAEGLNHNGIISGKFEVRDSNFQVGRTGIYRAIPCEALTEIQ